MPAASNRLDGACLITGGAGNLARLLARSLSPHFETLVLTDISPVAPVGLPENAVYEPGDITHFSRLRALMDLHKPRAVVHLASLLSGSSEQDRRQAWLINTTATMEIFELALALPGCRVLFASTVASYGGELPETVDDSVTQWPDTLYGVTKVASERLGAYYRAARGLDYRCARLPIVLSAQAPPAAVSAMISRAFIESAAQGKFVFTAGPATRIVGLHLEDAIAGMAQLLLAPRESIRQPVYNLSGFSATLDEISGAIKKQRPGIEHSFKPDELSENVLNHWPGKIDDSAARRDWGWKPRYDLAATAAAFVGAKK